MDTKLDESPSQSSKPPQSENGNAQNKNSHGPTTLRYNPKLPIKIASININEINRKLNSLNAIFKKQNLDILCIQQIYNFNKRKMEKWLTKNKIAIFVNQEIPPDQNPKYFRIGTAILLKDKIKQRIDISELILEKNRIQIIKIKTKLLNAI